METTYDLYIIYKPNYYDKFEHTNVYYFTLDKINNHYKYDGEAAPFGFDYWLRDINPNALIYIVRDYNILYGFKSNSYTKNDRIFPLLTQIDNEQVNLWRLEFL